MTKFLVKNNIALLDALALMFPGASKTSFRSWIKEGRVLINEVPVYRTDLNIEEGQVISLGARHKYGKGNLRILYEDRHIVVVEKPEGLLSVGTAFEKEETVHSYLKAQYKPSRVYPVHRLDQDTSGVMLFALNEEAKERLKKMFEKHALERKYVAILEGHLAEKSGTWQSYQSEDSAYHVYNTEDPTQGKLAITHFLVKGQSRRYSLVELTLETGRKNQIRAHCEMAGHPVVGDRKYGSDSNPIKRVCLHAMNLGFEHPFTHKYLRFSSTPPESFAKLVKIGTHENPS